MTRLDGPDHDRATQLATGALALLVVLLAVLALRTATRPAAAPVPFGAAIEQRLEPPRPLSAGESFVRSEVLASGEVEVTQWIESGELLFSLALSVPPPARPGAPLVEARDVRVVADGRPASGPRRITSTSGRYGLLGARSVLIRYRLTGAVELSPSAPGRALVRPTSLDVAADRAATTITRAVVAQQVLSLACTTPGPGSAPTPCGRPDGADAWDVELSGARTGDHVSAQVTMG